MGETRPTLARARLGLPEVVADFPGTWDIVQAQVATAFDAAQQEVAHAPPPE